MVDTKSEGSSTTDAAISAIYDNVKANVIRIFDETVKVQPAYSQSISNLQLDYIHAAKNAINAAFSAQKQIAGNLNIALPESYTEQFTKQANEFTDHLTRVVGINNQLTFSAVDGARENIKNYSRTVDAVTEFNTNAIRAWTTWYSAQQQFFKQ